ncbi:MAG: 1-acyl-sn-glycerol-3-phosphate acyltransferase [Sediminibacterium sp.]|nr:1-acyl-sn-glycerol-3-phosphate acyltransferase [Sediminibacterium sp.]
MIYHLFKKLIKAAIWLFCKELTVVNRHVFKTKGPLLVVANHPNSFLDAILIGAQFSGKIHFLARGDAFIKKHHRFFLRMLNMIPVYRLSEGKENLYLNEYAFTESRRILAAGGIVLLFIEGICINSHQLQPFKKGAARIAMNPELEETLMILPVAITYDSFSGIGKQVRIAGATLLPVNSLLPFTEKAKNYAFFNRQIKSRLEPLIQLPADTKPSAPLWAKPMIFTGRILHFPLYRLLSTIIRLKTKDTVFYDSVLFAALFVVYPIYLLLMGLLLLSLQVHPVFILMIILMHPLSARVYILFKG